MEFAAADDSTVVQISGSSNNSSSCCFEFADQTMDLLGSRHCRNSSSAAQIITADSSSSSNNNNNTTTNKSSKIMVEREHMFDKAVTPSDVGKLNRLVIPKQHAERFFPLDPNSTDKGLLLCFEDSAGKSWRFRYSYWNSSQSYVLTKGWSRFVKDKKLDAGDIVSFERERHVGSTSSETQNHHYHSLHQHRNQRLFISWRRRPKPNHHTNHHHHHHHHDIPSRNFHHHHLNPNFHHQFSRNNSPFCIQNLPHFNGAAADVTIMRTSTSVGNNSNGGSASSLGLPLRCIPRWLPFLPSENPPLLSVPVPVPVPVPVHMNLQMVTAAPPSQSSPYLLMEPPAAAAAAAAMMNTKAEEDYSSSSGREQSHAKKGSVRLFGVNLESAEENNNVDDDDEQQQQLERTSKNRISSSSSVLHSAKTLCVGPRAVLDL